MIGSRTRAAMYLVLLGATACGGNTYGPPASADAGLAPLSSSFSVKSCTTIAKAGTYTMTANLTGNASTSGPSCITVQNTSNVTLNCKNHTITGAAPDIDISNVTGFTIENCNLQQAGYGGGPLLNIQNSPSGTLTLDTLAHDGSPEQGITEVVNVAHSSKLTVKSNAIYAELQVAFSTGVVISNNTFRCGLAPSGLSCPALVALSDGSSNQIVNNTMDGESGTDGGTSAPGTDDDITLSDETSDLVESNTMKNVYDCALETWGEVASTTISKNTISNASNCGIGGWYFMSLSNSNIVGNTVNGAGQLFNFFRSLGLRPAGYKGPGSPAETGVYFTNNNFQGNTLTNSYAGTGGFASNIPFDESGQYLGYNGQISSNDPGEVAPTPSQFHLSNNTFSGNDFGTVGQAFFGIPEVAGAVVDKGGNLCVAPGYAGYPLACGTPH